MNPPLGLPRQDVEAIARALAAAVRTLLTLAEQAPTPAIADEAVALAHAGLALLVRWRAALVWETDEAEE